MEDKRKNLKHTIKKAAFLLLAGLMLTNMLTGCVINPSYVASGATFPQPLYDLWFKEYAKLTGVKVNYRGGGSGQGINDTIAGLVAFGASDALLTPDQLQAAQKAFGDLLTIPMAAGAIAIIYNIDGVPRNQLCLSGPVLADIYLGRITKWNDPVITSINPDIKLPEEDNDIAVVVRGDSSGTTNMFTNYLSKVSTEWVNGPSSGNIVNWPASGIAGLKNAGVDSTVAQTPNSIGYVELAYAIQNDRSYAKLQNSAGNFILPSCESATAAAEGFVLPDDMRIVTTNSSNPDAYPIVGFTWILIYANQTDEKQGKELVDLLWWAIHEGQNYCYDLHYAKLSDDAVTKAEVLIKSIKYDGNQLYAG